MLQTDNYDVAREHSTLELTKLIWDKQKSKQEVIEKSIDEKKKHILDLYKETRSVVFEKF